MYRMLIVDDEALARYAFRTLISKNFSNIEVIGEAESGREAIKLNHELKPDIIIMDIKIPGMNGLDASREILRDFPDTKILILTAYDNFDYIHQALDMGVKGYLLKPLQKDEIIEKVNRVINDINESKSKIDLNEIMENKISKVKPFIEKEIAMAFITGNIDIDEVKSYINFMQYKISKAYCILISSGDNYSSFIDDSVRNKVNLTKAYDVVTNYLPLTNKCIIGSPIGNVINVFITLDDEKSSANNCARESTSIAQEIKRKIKVIAGIEVAVGIGNAYNELQDYKISYDEASLALKQAIHKEGIIHYSTMLDKPIDNSCEYPFKLETQFLGYIKTGNIDNARELVNDIMSCIFNNHFNIALIKEYISQFMVVFTRAVWQMGIDVGLYKNEGMLMELNSMSELNELELWFKRNISTIIKRVELQKYKKDSGVMKQVYEYINRQYSREITLSMAAQEVGLSSQYFSKLFKEEYGVNFIDYITDKRIEHAKALLKSTNNGIKEISAMVGYTDINYFCRIFKKITGITPKQYRNQR